jgi:hypothetical protein
MENASKALIIAGAILLAILIISLSIFIFNQAQTVINGSGMTQAEVTSFNNQFLKYEGEKKGSEVKSLIQEVNVNNSQDDSSEKQIELTGVDKVSGDDATAYKTSGIINTKTYTITVEEYSKNGRITKISIK